MNAVDPCADLQRTMGELFTCAPQGEFQRVRTPYLYPDGDNIDLFLKTTGDVTTVSDLGETLRWLRSQTLSPRRSPKQNALIADACLTHGVELYKGMVLARCRPGDSLAEVTTRVAQACLRVSDLWFTFRTRRWSPSPMRWRTSCPSGNSTSTPGQSTPGSRDKPGALTSMCVRSGRSFLVYVLSTGSRSAARFLSGGARSSPPGMT